MPIIYDNIEKKLEEGLNHALEVSHRSDFCVGYFNLRGWRKIASNIDKWSGEEGEQCRLLIGMQQTERDTLKQYFSLDHSQLIDRQTASRIKKELALDFKKQLTIGYPTNQDEAGLRILVKQLKANKLVVKLYLRHPLHAKLYLAYRDDKINPIIGYLGSSNLTTSGLANNGELNIDVLDNDASKKLSDWFQEKWVDTFCVDISKELIEIIEESWAGEQLTLPYHIYLKMAYHLSREARAGLNEFKIPKVFEEDLLEFQQKAVLISAHHLNKRGGVIIGDVVGLGKTITATALAKIFEDDFFWETLILCPKNLTEMWGDYVHKYKLRAKIFSISRVLTKEFQKLRRYRLVIIDESHNLRNRESKTFRAVQEYLHLNDSKVIMLSATPYNKTFQDLSNQLRLFISVDDDLGISPENYIESIGGKIEFESRFPHHYRSLPAFEKSEDIDDWRELMRLFLVRRTRSFIKQNYAITDDKKQRKYLLFSNGDRSYFPDRIPKRMNYEMSVHDPNDQYAKLYSENVVDAVNNMKLARYGIGNYIKDNPQEKPTNDELFIIDNLTRAGKRLIGFSRTNLFKRLESSGYSFLLSAYRMMLRNYIFIYAVENNLPIPIGSQEANVLDYFTDELDWENYTDNEKTLRITTDETKINELSEKIYNELATKRKKKFSWIRTELFERSFKKHLLNDCDSLTEIIKLSENWKPENDRQLNALEKLITQEHPHEKILIFTQFADTAKYLHSQLVKREVDNIFCVTGSDKNPTEFAHRFSPISNEKPNIKNSEDEIRVLISTDVLSEGQNLQDAHIVLNYDLPWALIRLIQRIGRVDRIGQKSNRILSYFFFPEDGIENIIRLREKLDNRLEENAEVVGSDERFFENQNNTILENLYHEKSGILDEEDSEIDLASFAFQIWKNAIEKNPNLKKIIPELPDVSYSTKTFENEGVLVYTKTAENNDVLSWVNKEGDIITQSQMNIIKAAACEPKTKAIQRLDNHHQLVKRGVEVAHIIEKEIGGTLGRKNSAKYRTYMRLSKYCENYPLFVTTELKNAIDEIFKFPLKEFARETLNRQLKAGIEDAELAELIVSLREEERLCIIGKQKHKTGEPQIICSLGLKSK